jgi:hypothetical protein
MKNGRLALRVSILAAVLAAGGLPSAPTAQTARPAGHATVSGRVRDVNGKGMRGVVVAAEGQKASARTGSDGAFTLAGVKPGAVYLFATAPSEAYLDGETLRSILVRGGTTTSGVEIVLSGRPSASATYVGVAACAECHDAEVMKAFDGTPQASAHSRFVTEGTSHMVYSEKWPAPADKYLPRDPKGDLLMVQDPADGKGLVHVVLCTRGDAGARQYLFKFYPELKNGASVSEADLDCSSAPADAIWIPVAGTIGGEGNWGEAYTDPRHVRPDRHPNFGEGKQRYLAKIEDVPAIAKWMKDNGVNREGQKQDYVAYLPVYIMQDGTPEGSRALAKGEVGAPMFWQKSPKDWASPDNTLSRNCAGCHATGIRITTKDFPGEKAVVTDWTYQDLNVTCERCHGPGSEHVRTSDKARIISPRYLTAKAGNELCGQCHASHDGKSRNPEGIFKAPFDATYANTLGHGFFVPGVDDLATFYYGFDKVRVDRGTEWKKGSFMTWPDQTHGTAHSQEYAELRRSPHWNNGVEKLTCYTCHDAHSLDGGGAALEVGNYRFVKAAYGNNTLCLACHATHGPFKDVSTADVAALQLDAGRTVTRNGAPVTVEPADLALARNRVARAVARHMQAGAGMGGAIYTPDDPRLPVGNCTSCHMPKTGKLQDLNVDAEYHLDLDESGKSAMAEGNVASHVFDIVWPAQSAVLRNPDPSKGHDYDIIPNSCSKCHAFARISGDAD